LSEKYSATEGGGILFERPLQVSLTFTALEEAKGALPVARLD